MQSVKIGKYVRVSVADGPGELARVREMCDRLLANPVIEDYRIVEAEGAVSAG